MGLALVTCTGKPGTSGETVGWRFLAGDESDECGRRRPARDLRSKQIANYVQDSIPFLESPQGSRFVRDPMTGKLVADSGPPNKRLKLAGASK